MCVVDTVALLERRDYRGEEISMLVMDECQAGPGIFEITSRVYVSEEDLGKIADALIDAKARGEVVNKYILRTPGSPDEVEVVE